MAQLIVISSHHFTCYLGEEINSHLATSSFQIVLENDKAPHKSPLLHAKQLQLPRLLLNEVTNMGEEEQCCDLFRNVTQCPSGTDEPLSLQLTELHSSDSSVLILEFTQMFPRGSIHMF